MGNQLFPKPIIPLKIGNKQLEFYENLLIKSDTGLHNQLSFIVGKEFADEKDIKILDIAAGEGALSYRLYNQGYKNIDAVDIELKNFKFTDVINFSELNLNDFESVNLFKEQNFKKYDLVLGIETIEHLENPWQYLRLLKNLVKDDGLIIISTPNINSIFSKVTFLFLDYFFHFSPASLEYWHINPISTFEMYTICAKTGLKIKQVFPGGTYPIIWITKSPIFSVMFSFFNIILYPFTRGMKYGWCCIYIIKLNLES